MPRGLRGKAVLAVLCACAVMQVRFMGLAFGGKELVFEEDPNLDLRKVHYHLIRDKGLSLVSVAACTNITGARHRNPTYQGIPIPAAAPATACMHAR